MSSNSTHNIINFPGNNNISPIPDELEKDIMLGKFQPSTGNVIIKSSIDSKRRDSIQYSVMTNDAVKDGDADMSNEIELLKQQVNNLEQQFDLKLEARDKLLDAKLENLSLKMESVEKNILSEIKLLNSDIKSQIGDSIQEYKKEVDTQQKETRSFVWTVAGVGVAIVSVIVAIITPIVQHLLK